MYALNAVSKYQAFVDDVNEARQRIGSTESTILLGDFNTPIGTDNETWKGMFSRHGMEIQCVTRMAGICSFVVATGSIL